jgi:AraC family transcriptional regulator
MRRRGVRRLGENCYRARVPAAALTSPAVPTARSIASGRGFSIDEYVCHAGPEDRPFEEQHSRFTIAAVVGGSFVYQSERGKGLLYPGSLLLGNFGACFQCGHDHSTGDRCISFQYDQELFAELAATAAGTSRFRFPASMVPAGDELLPLVTAAEVAVAGESTLALEELALRVAEQVLGMTSGEAPRPARVVARDEQRISEVLHVIEERSEEALDLDELAAIASLSKYHFLRTFRNAVGRSPYQYLLSIRLRRVALELARSEASVSSIALDAGFGDLSTFNRRFREVFGQSPLAYRRRYGAYSGRPS